MKKQSDNGQVRIIACGALAREIIAISQLNKIANFNIDCLPAILHNSPEQIAPSVKTAIDKARQDGFEKIFIAYADCGTSGELDKVCEAEGVQRIRGPHCYSFFTGNESFENSWNDDMSAFFLTDFLARQFETLIIQPYKLDKHPELLEIMFANYTKLIYLAQTRDDKLVEKAKSAALFLKLEYEYRFTGYGDLSEQLIDLDAK